MAEHALVVPVYPWQRVARTVLVDLFVWGPTAVVAIPVLVDGAAQLRSSGVLPPATYAQVVGVAAAALAVSGAITRILSLPPVDALLQRIGLGTVPRATVDAGTVQTVKDTAAAIEQIVAQRPGSP